MAGKLWPRGSWLRSFNATDREPIPMRPSVRQEAERGAEQAAAMMELAGHREAAADIRSIARHRFYKPGGFDPGLS